MLLGRRIIYNPQTGKNITDSFSQRDDSGLTQEMIDELRPETMEYIDLPYDYNDNNFKEVLEFHIDVTKPVSSLLSERIVITKYAEHAPTYEELQHELLRAQGVIV